jgi:3-hydroxy acid dehydrogenase / malonic semialdehyde reductase
MQNLQNKLVFITGASSGIGEACARQFAQNNCRLILAARRIDRLQQLVSDLKNHFNAESHLLQLDVRDHEHVKNAIASLPPHWQDIDILLNNAGLAAGLAPLQEGDIEDWDKMIDTNIKGLLYVTRAILPGMVQRNRGHIVNIGSIAGHEVYPQGAVYCASKYAVKAISQGLKMDLLGTQIRVTSIDPGMVETEFSLVRFAGDEKRAAKVYEDLTPLAADDIADAVIYAASRPVHVNISDMIILPTAQSSATLVKRKPK